MSTCRYCGDEIEFRYIDGRPTPIHLSGGWCQGGEGASYSPRASLATPAFQFEDVCRPTPCPECGILVFFVRHNGGSVWFDDLGWPWPKHSCFDNEPVPPWFGYLVKQLSSTKPGNTVMFGVIIRAEWIAEDSVSPCRIVLAVDGGESGKACLAISGLNTADYFLGKIAVIDVQSNRLVTSNYEERSILPIHVRPVDLGLQQDWDTIKVHLEG